MRDDRTPSGEHIGSADGAPHAPGLYPLADTSFGATLDTAAPVPPEPSSATPFPAAEKPARPGRAGIWLAILAATLVATVVGSTAGAAAAWLLLRGNGPAAYTVRVLPSSTEEVVTAAVAAAMPSVVNLDVSGEATSVADPDLPQGHPGVPRRGNGSGVAFREAPGGGTFLLTNDHVVQGADEIIVRGADGEPLTAELVGTDPERDIAVIKVDASIPLIETGDSKALRVGDLVVAIGSPFGLSRTVTAGVVSALGRSLPEFENAQGYPLVDVIQTDAAINPGNSGGALVNRAGKLIGVNTAIYSDSGASGGIGFAIPVHIAVRVAGQLIAGETVEHPFLGVIGTSVTKDLAEEKNLPVTEGALVAEIAEGSGAKKAGILPEDIIVRADETPIRSFDDLILAVRRLSVGDTVKLGLYRDGELIEVDMVVGQKPEGFRSRPATREPTATP